MRTWIRIVLISLFAWSCSEAPLINPTEPARLNNPVSMALIPGTNLAVVANANVNLDQVMGSLVAVDVSTRELLLDTAIEIPNFAGRLRVDSSRNRIYIPDRGNDALLIFEYSIPGTDGQPISFTSISVSNPADKTTNGVRTDEVPFDVMLATGTSQGDILMVTNNLSGSLSVIPVGSLSPLDLDPEDNELLGLPLISAANFQLKKQKPGIGANKITSAPGGRLFYVTSTRTNNIYVVDSFDQKVEAMLDLSTVSFSGGTRGLVLASNGLAYLAHRGIDSVVVFDVSGVTENGIDFEIQDFKLVDVVPMGLQPEDVVLDPTEQTLFVTCFGDNTVHVMEVASRTVRTQTLLNASGPGQITVDTNQNVLYVLNFLSDSISVLDLTSGALVDTIQ